MNRDKRYKYYLFYGREDKHLYGYTDDKTIRKLFLKIRNPHYFNEIEEKIDKPTVNLLARDYKNCKISIQKLPTYDYDNQKMTTIPVAIVDWEYQSLISYSQKLLLSDIFQLCWVDINFFKDDVKKCLKKLNYDIYSSILSNTQQVDSEDMMTRLKNIETIQVDYFQAFIKLYKETLLL